MRVPSYDVLIAGGGLTGQSLARQLKRARPELRVAVIERERRPLPEAAFKIGEATSELGAHYFSQKIALGDYLHRDHLLKCGLRFFFGDARGPLLSRPEYGPREYPPLCSFQVDRGRMENHLRTLNESAGVDLWEGYEVQDMVLGRGVEGHRTVVCERGGVEPVSIVSEWLVDCTGRRRILQTKLGLGTRSPLCHSACWFRVAGKCDVSDWVPSDATRWHNRVPGGIRYRSTNHLAGYGYWVWLIPLASGNTSLGIVVDERIHPIAAIDTYEKALVWLEVHEPVLAGRLASFKVMDFGSSQEFSYATRQFISEDRWACVGEAAMFLDPFYSPGADFTALGNTLVAKLILRHAEQTQTSDTVRQADATLLMLQRAFTEVFRNHYPTFGHPRVMTAKILWDNASYWVFVCQMFFQDVLLDDEQLDRYSRILQRYHELNRKVQQLFRDWAERSRNGSGYSYLGYADFPIAVRSHLELETRRSPAKCLDWVESNLDRFSAWAIVLFQIAVEDVAPEHLNRLRDEELTPTCIDLHHIERAAERSKAGSRSERNRLLPELASLRRQMRKLFPDHVCLLALRPSGPRQHRVDDPVVSRKDPR